MASERKYTIAFQTKTELKAVEDTTKAVEEAGKKAEEAGDKFVQAAEDAEEAFKRTEKGAKEAADSFGEAGQEAGKNFSAGVDQGQGKQKIAITQDALGAVQEAWALGTMIGEELGAAITRVWENGLSWESILNLEEGEDVIEEMRLKIEALNADLADKSSKFWAKYWETGVKGMDDWLDAFKRNMAEAEARFKALDAIQDAQTKQRISQVNQRAEGQLTGIANSGAPESQKIQERAKVESERQLQLAEIRRRQREREVQEAERALRLQEDDVRAKQNAEAVAQRRAAAYEQADANAQKRIKEAGTDDARVTRAIRSSEFDKVSQATGIQLDPEKDAMAELEQVKAARKAAEDELRRLSTQTTAAKRVSQIEQETDNQETASASARAAQETAARVREAQAKEAAAAKKKEEEDKKALEKAQAEDATKPGSAEADARQVVRQVAGSTSNIGAKATLDGLSQDLEDGTASTANIEALTSLAERLRASNNKQNVKLAELLTNALERMIGDVNGQDARIQALEARIEALIRTPNT